MTQKEFLQTYPEFIQGMAVKSADGQKVGVVQALREKDFIVERGFFFPHDYVVTFDQVTGAARGEVVLNRSAEQLKSDGFQPGISLQSADSPGEQTDRHPTLDERVA